MDIDKTTSKRELINVSSERDVLSDSKSKISNSKDKAFFSSDAVDEGGRGVIEIRFETLIAANCQMPYDWYKLLRIDKSLASKIRRGIIIPKKEMRIRIASHFKCDSATIWPVDYKKWCELNDAVDGFWDKVGASR